MSIECTFLAQHKYHGNTHETSDTFVYVNPSNKEREHHIQCYRLCSLCWKQTTIVLCSE